jgi:hypothetical protein
MSERERVWRERIEWQQWSGLTVAECCEAAGVSVASFYRWKKLLTEPQPAAAHQRTPRKCKAAPPASGLKKSSSQFVSIALRDPATNSGASKDAALDAAPGHRSSMRIELPNGVVIHVADGLDGQRLGDVIIAAGQIPCVLPDTAARGLLRHEVSSC